MYNDDNNGTNNGNRGKWSERLYRMKNKRLYKNNDEFIDEKTSFKEVRRNIFKIILVLPSFIYSNVKGNHNQKLSNNRNKLVNNINFKDNMDIKGINRNNFDNTLLDNNSLDDEDRIHSLDVNKIKEIDILKLKRNRDNLLKYKDIINNDDIINEINNLDIQLRKNQLQNEIINLIKKRLVKNINELEMLQSDFYVLNEINNDDIYLNKCKDNIKEIKKLLSKVKVLREKYECLRENNDFEYLLEFDDDLLIDKILELKDICSNYEIKQTIDDYKILEEYKCLYLKIDMLQENSLEYENYKNEKIEELKQRDIDFDKMKEKIYDFDRENERYNDFVWRQEQLCLELNDKISKIDSYERFNYKLKGFNQLLGNSFKYMGLLLISPLKGLVPGIVTQTVITKNVVSNLYRNLEWEENKKIVYNAINYADEINIALNDIDNAALMINSTLEEVIKMKSKYINEFSKYEGSFSSYKDAIKKINKIENAVIGNKIKLEKIRENMKEKERLNDIKMKKVKKLNSME